MPVRIAIPDLISPSYFPVIAAVELDFFAREGLEATIELVFPITETYQRLREGEIDYVGGAAHAALYAFEEWEGCSLIGALSQNMYWFLVVRADLEAARGDLGTLKGLRVGAAPGPVDGLRRMLEVAGIDPDEDLILGPVPGAESAGVSFGVTAARALEEGAIDAFWANGMGAEVAVQRGVGKVVVDARRGEGPSGAEDYTFPSLVATEERIESRLAEATAAVRALMAAQRALSEDPSRATEAARKAGFPDYETSLIAKLIERDAPFYDVSISEHKVRAMNRFARDLGILSSREIEYEKVVDVRFVEEWSR